MRTFHQLLCFACLALASVLPSAAAQTPIRRCIGADGHPVFTDQPCAALNATPVTSAKGRANERAPEPPPAILCASSVDELKRAVIDAFASGDANRMAGLMLWNGYGRQAAVADIRALQRAMREPLLDFGDQAEVDDGFVPPSDDAFSIADSGSSARTRPAAPRDDTLVLHTAGNNGSGEPPTLRFRIVRRSGCLWLRSAD